MSIVVAYVLTFAFGYALFERYGSPCNILPWCGYNWLGLDFYQYGFMLPLFTLIALIPFIRQVPMDGAADLRAFGSFLLAVLAEDSIYFVLDKRPIPPGVYTTQWGYFLVYGFAIPYWYFFFLSGVVTSFYLAQKFANTETPFRLRMAPLRAILLKGEKESESKAEEHQR